MRVDVVGKDHLLLLRHAFAKIDADVAVAAALAHELEAHVMIARERHEVRGVAPEFLELEGLAVPQLHHQRRVDVVEKTLHRIAHEDRRMLQHRRAVASAMARKDELIALAQAKAALLQLTLHFAQHHALLGGRQALHLHGNAVAPDALVDQLPFRDAAQRQHAKIVLRAAQGANHGLRVGIDPLRREQDVSAIVEFLHHAGTVEQTDHCLQGFVREAWFIRQPPQKQFAQFLEGVQHPPFVP